MVAMVTGCNGCIAMAALVAKAAILKTLCTVHYTQQVTSECKAKKIQK